MTEQADARRIAEANNIIMGTLENGPWMLIEDPALRKLVGEYVADTCHSIAAATGLDEAMACARNTLPQRLATGGRLVTSEARDRLARHLYLEQVPAGWRDHHELLWDRRSDRIDYDAVYARADELLAVITREDRQP